MSESEERREQEDVEAHRRVYDQPPDEEGLDRRRRVSEGEEAPESDEDDVQAHRR
jgi:hypothetical protein